MCMVTKEEKNFKKRKSTKWSEEDIMIIKTYYKQGGARLCQEKGLNRSIKDIGSRAYKLGLKMGKVVKKWTDSDDAYLIANYDKLSRKEIANHLGRTVESVSQRMKRKGLQEKGATKWSEEECSILDKYYEEGGARLCQEKGLNRTLEAIKVYANKRGLSRNIGYTDEVKELIMVNYPKGGSRLCVDLCKELGYDFKPESIRQFASLNGLTSPFNKRDRFNLWTDEEIEILKKYYKEGGIALCKAKGLNSKNDKAIVYKASKFGLKRRKMSRWTDEEINILKESYPKGGIALCRENGLNRNDNLICSKASALGLHRDKSK